MKAKDLLTAIISVVYSSEEKDLDALQSKMRDKVIEKVTTLEEVRRINELNLKSVPTDETKEFKV